MVSAAAFARVLRDHDADADIVNPAFGESVLHTATRRGNLPLARILIGPGTNVNAASAIGAPPLHYAAGLEGTINASIAALLIVHGAGVSAPDRRGLTPLHYAGISAVPGLVSLLLRREANVSVAAALHGRSFTPLQLAREFPDGPDAATLRTFLRPADPAAPEYAEVARLLEDWESVCAAAGQAPMDGMCACAAAGHAVFVDPETDEGRCAAPVICPEGYAGGDCFGPADTVENFPNPEDLCGPIFGGDPRDAGGGRRICRGIDASGAFCVVGSEFALPCRGLFKHVLSCNRIGRLALDPFLCGKRCETTELARGGKCETLARPLSSGAELIPLAPME